MNFEDSSEKNLKRQAALEWSGQVRSYEITLRNKAQEQNWNQSKIMLGAVVNKITNDDGNIFFWSIATEYNSFEAETARLSILKRLDWETNVPEITQEIKDKLQKVNNAFNELDSNKEKDYQTAVNKWREIKQWLQQEIKKDGEIKEAYEYLEKMHELL